MAVKVLLPADRSEPRGTLYLLDGNSGQIEENNWLAPANGDIVPFFADKNVNVVLPIGGTGTMYTDWQEDHPKFGRLKWETFLTKELPPLIDTRFATNGHNAIGGISMGAEAALILAQRSAGLYDVVAGYSGCYTTVGGFGKALTDLVVINGNARSEQMWGPAGSEAWQEHDIFANADKLRGTKVYLASGSGLPGPHETLDTPAWAGYWSSAGSWNWDRTCAPTRSLRCCVIAESMSPAALSRWGRTVGRTGATNSFVPGRCSNLRCPLEQFLAMSFRFGSGL